MKEKCVKALFVLLIFLPMVFNYSFERTAAKLIEEAEAKGTLPRTADEWEDFLETRGFQYNQTLDNRMLIPTVVPFTPLSTTPCAVVFAHAFMAYQCNRKKYSSRMVKRECEPRGKEEVQTIENFLKYGTIESRMHMIDDWKNKENVKLLANCESNSLRLSFDLISWENVTVLTVGLSYQGYKRAVSFSMAKISSIGNSVSEELRISKDGRYSLNVVHPKRNQLSSSLLMALDFHIDPGILAAVIAVVGIMVYICCKCSKAGLRSRQSDSERHCPEEEKAII